MFKNVEKLSEIVNLSLELVDTDTTPSALLYIPLLVSASGVENDKAGAVALPPCNNILLKFQVPLSLMLLKG